MGKIRVGVAESETIVREGLIALLKNSKKYLVTFDVETTKEAVKRIGQRKTDVVLIGFEQPFIMQVQLISEIKKRQPEIRIIMLAADVSMIILKQLQAAGLDAMIFRKTSFTNLDNAISNVMEYGEWFDDDEFNFRMMKNEQDEEKFNLWSKMVITEREREVMLLICDGITNKEIADKLFIDERTVETHREHIFEKVQCKNAAELSVFAVNMGFIDLLDKKPKNIENPNPVKPRTIVDFNRLLGYF